MDLGAKKERKVQQANIIVLPFVHVKNFIEREKEENITKNTVIFIAQLTLSEK